jgi:choline dehydrogenase-like flavoprotein
MSNAEVIIIGSGAGGATLAHDLSKGGKRVLVLERGKREQIGTFWDAARFYDLTSKALAIPRHSIEGVVVWRAFMAGGTTVVAMGNIARCLEKELAAKGIDLQEELAAAEGEIGLAPNPEPLLSKGSKALRAAAAELGYTFRPTPKFIDVAKCCRCAKCCFGCPEDAKWSALRYLEPAVSAGVEVRYQTTVTRILSDGGAAHGVLARGPRGTEEIHADVVVVAAGALATPAILRSSGIDEAGRALFVDPMTHVYGATEKLNLQHEPNMAIIDLDFEAKKGFLLSSYIGPHAGVRYMEAGFGGLFLRNNRSLGIMTKIADESVGEVFPDGRFSKTITPRDRGRLDEGISIAKQILLKTGIAPSSMRTTKVVSAHPGGSAAVGEVVGTDLQTKIRNLYVCDASVLPVAPGLPPILTIVALAKRLAKQLA